MSIKLYTKTGDKGQTSLLGGRKISKADLRIEAYGTVDELNSFVGLLRDQKGIEKELPDQLHWIQERLFTLGSILAADGGFKGFELPQISVNDTSKLEGWIDQFDLEVPPLANFILPGGTPSVSMSHVCRTICRRLERSVIALSETTEISPFIFQFLNRLSDYFFIFARVLSVRLKVEEILWKPAKA